MGGAGSETKPLKKNALPPPPPPPPTHPPPPPTHTHTPLQAVDLARLLPASQTAAGNRSSPWQLHGWVLPNKNTTAGAAVRAAVAIVDSPNPLNATKAAARGLELYKRETKALILGQSGLVTYASSVRASPTAASDLKCFVDPATGQLVGLEQPGGAVSCSTAGSAVVVPTSTAGYISQIKLAYSYDGLFVGRLIFELRANATAKPVSYACGSAGGKAVSLLPNDNGYAVSKIVAGCAALPATDAGRRRKLKAGPGLGLSAR